MITKVTITDNKNTPLSYVRNIWENGASWDFKKGVNIIIGENGCGKSTLLNLIAHYGLCRKGMVSQIPDTGSMLEIGDLFAENSVKDGCKVNMDYNSVLFRYTPSIEQEHKEDILDNFESFQLYMNSVRSSMGEGMLIAFKMLIKMMNDTKDLQFPINQIREYAKSLNQVWAERMKGLLQYYADNQIQVSSEDFEYTVLMDEPDRNLDIDNIKDLYKVLSYHRPMTQLLCVIHNPLLIYKLAQTDVNIIEMTPNYLNKIKSFVNGSR